jgi:hypothetical protein
MWIIRGSWVGVVVATLIGPYAFAAPPEPADASAARRAELASRIQTMLARQRAELDSKRTTLDTKTLSLNCKGLKVFKAEAVRNAYDSIRSDALHLFTGPDAAVTKAQLEPEFPRLPQASSSGCIDASPFYTQEQVKILWTAISAWLEKAERSSLLMDVGVRSNAEHAQAKLRPADGTTTYGPRRTDCTFPKLFQGTYQVTVEKDGYKKFDGEIRLSGSTTPEIQCDLANDSDAGKSECSLK